MTGLLDHPPGLTRSLAGLENLWKDTPNPLCAWRAIELCLLAAGEDGQPAGSCRRRGAFCISPRVARGRKRATSSFLLMPVRDRVCSDLSIGSLTELGAR
jgi:hypothetical protein